MSLREGSVYRGMGQAERLRRWQGEGQGWRFSFSQGQGRQPLLLRGGCSRHTARPRHAAEPRRTLAVPCAVMLRREELSAMSRSPQTKHRELRERCTTRRNRYYLIECAWCKKRIRWKRKQGDVPGDTSHSICPPCAAAILSEMATLQPPDFS
jgi:hypothetical protein